MAADDAGKLDLMDRFPEVRLDLVGGGSLTLPEGLASPFTVLLFYRGHW